MSGYVRAAMLRYNSMRLFTAIRFNIRNLLDIPVRLAACVLYAMA